MLGGMFEVFDSLTAVSPAILRLSKILVFILGLCYFGLGYMRLIVMVRIT